MLGGGVRFCRWSVAPLRLGFPGGAGDAKATALLRNNFSQLLPFSDGAVYSDINGEAGETFPGVEGRCIIVFFRW
jgi:hypothetical protein